MKPLTIEELKSLKLMIGFGLKQTIKNKEQTEAKAKARLQELRGENHAGNRT